MVTQKRPSGSAAATQKKTVSHSPNCSNQLRFVPLRMKGSNDKREIWIRRSRKKRSSVSPFLRKKKCWDSVLICIFISEYGLCRRRRHFFLPLFLAWDRDWTFVQRYFPLHPTLSGGNRLRLSRQFWHQANVIFSRGLFILERRLVWINSIIALAVVIPQ